MSTVGPRPSTTTGAGRAQQPAPMAVLVQEICDILKKGEDGATPSAHAELQAGLRSGLVRLLDLAAPGPSSSSRETGVMLQLLKLTLEKVPHWLVDGGGSGSAGNALLLTLLERLLPMLLCPLPDKAWRDLVDVLGRILLRVAETEEDQFEALLRTFSCLFEDVYAAAIALSLDASTTAVVKCNLNFLRTANGNNGAAAAAAAANVQTPQHRELQLRLEGPAPCERALQALLTVIAEALTPHPALSVTLLPAAVLQGTCCLLGCSSVPLQASSMQLAAAALRGHSCPRAELRRLPEHMLRMLRSARVHLAATAASSKEEWHWRLVALLQAIADCSQGAAAAATLPGVFTCQTVAQMAVEAALRVADPASDAQTRLCLLVAELAASDIQVLAGLAASVLRLVLQAAAPARRALLSAIQLFLQSAPQAHVQAAFAAAKERLKDEIAGQSRGAELFAAPAAAAAAAGAREAAAKRQRLGEGETGGEIGIDLMETEGFLNEEESSGEPSPGVNSVTYAVLVAINDAQDAVEEEGGGLVPSRCRCSTLLALADTLEVLAPVVPVECVTWGSDALRAWPGWVQHAQQRGGSRAAADDASGELSAALCLLSATMQAAAQCPEGYRLPIDTFAVVGDLNALLLACVRGEGSSAVAAMPASVLAALLGLLDPVTDLPPILDGARGTQSGTQAVRAALLPAAAFLAARKAGADAARSRSRPPPGGLPSNPVKGLLMRMAWKKEDDVIKALIRGLLIVVTYSHSPANLVVHAVHAATSGAFSPLQPSTESSAVLPPSTSDWLRATLDALRAATEAANVPAALKSSTDLVAVVAAYLELSSVGEAEQSQKLAKWLLSRAGASGEAVRAAVLQAQTRRLFSQPQLLLALHQEAPHPTHSRDRRAAADKMEHETMKALKEQLRVVSADAAKTEDLLQLVAHLGWSMHSPSARMISLAILVLALEQKDIVVASIAAECLKGIAALSGCSVRDMLFSTPRLLDHVARQLPTKPDLLIELADLVGSKPESLALSVLPKALPQLFAVTARGEKERDDERKRNRLALEALATQAGVSLKRLFVEHGHHALAASLMHGAPAMDDLIPLAEEISSGQDFIMMARSILPRVVSEMVAQAGSTPDIWRNDALTQEGYLHACKMLQVLVSTTNGGDAQGHDTASATACKVNVAEFLADGDHVTRMLKEFGDELERRLGAAAAAAARAAATGTGAETQSAAAAAGPGVTATLSVLRSVLVLIRLTGPFVGRFLPQFMVLLGAAVRPANRQDIKLQGLAGWELLVQALAAEAPVQLGGVVNQIVVALLDLLQEGPPVASSAAKVVESVILACRALYPHKIRLMPPLPQDPPELRHVNMMLAKPQPEGRGQLLTEDHVELLLESLNDEALSVRSMALQELRGVLASRRDWLLGLELGTAAAADVDPTLLVRLLGALLKASEPEGNSAASVAAQQAAAECLGMLGAIDPARVYLDPSPSPHRIASDAGLAVELLTKHLVPLLKTAHSLSALDATTLAIQEVLRCQAGSTELREMLAAAKAAAEEAQAPPAKGKSPAGQQRRAARGGGRAATPQPEPNAIFSVLPEEMQAIVRPYLDSKFSYRATGRRVQGVVFGSSKGLSFPRWLTLWLTGLIDQHVSGESLALFQAVKPVLRHEIPTAMFLAPYIVLNAVMKGGGHACVAVIDEFAAVLRNTNPAATRDSVLCTQAVFTLLDVLQRWLEEAKSGAGFGGGGSGQSTSFTTDPGNAEEQLARFTAEWGDVERLLKAVRKDKVASAAAGCGAIARALLHFETHLRGVEGGGASNPAAAPDRSSPKFSDKDVTFLLRVYSRLEEPDGLDGLVKLRQGGPRPEDQRLAAEKAGSWSEALTLYERDLARAEEGTADGAAARARVGTRQGYLNCLLQMGHWQGLLTQVEGMGALAAGPASVTGGGSSGAKLAAMGAAAAWRLGRWPLLERYVGIAEAGFAQLTAAERWEVRIGLLLQAAASGEPGALEAQLEASRAEVMGPFSAAAMESYSRAYSHLVKLHMLQEIADAASVMGREHGPCNRKRTLKWDDRLKVTQSTLATQAPILALRRQLATLSNDADTAGQCWLKHAQLCVKTGHLDAAGPAVLQAAAAGVPGSSLERVELLYARGEHHRALSELHTLEAALKVGGGDGAWLPNEGERAQYRSRVLLKLAQWTAETGQGAREEVSQLFVSALDARKPVDWETGLFSYAAYLDQLMQDAKARQEDAASAAYADPRMDRLGGKSRIKLGEDRHHLTFLSDVLQNYGKSISAGSQHIYRSLPRMLTLWFEFGAAVPAAVDQSREERAICDEVMFLMRGFSKTIPLHCWLVALPQLISRICHKHTEVSGITKTIVTEATKTYPQQALWALAAVSKSHISSRRSAANAIINNAKRAAASEAEKRVFTEHGSLCEQLIKLCHTQPTSSRRVLSAKRDLQLTALIRTMPLGVMVPMMSALTPSLPPEKAAGRGAAAVGHAGWRPFGDPVTISGLRDEIEVMSSLQKPKKIVLVGSDGRDYPFLAKPKDDLRKDCRMMEVAGVVNRLFLEDPGSRRRNLYLRRFAVLPITEDCGLVEWVCHTRPMRTCINDMHDGAEVRLTNNAAKVTYDRAAKAGRPGLRAWLDDMLRSNPPRFHRWFLAKWAEPAAWLSARLAYTRTYAAWCMVGHIVGLGDRHGENVLMDMRMGDAMQIDFGCLFDKGLTLTLPEMVPFRLTQNVIDAFGVAGVEGVYRRSCEVTLGVLRKHKDTILSVMDTFVHDPLVEWTPREDRKRVGGAAGGNEAENSQAKDALATIEGRLRGTLLGVSSRPCMALSVEGHVHRLVLEATSKDNLSLLYIWWQAWW